MFYVSEITKEAPQKFLTELQRETYQNLKKLAIPFERVETDEAITMSDCQVINQKLSMEMVKTLFLTNRQKTSFYLLVTTGEKPFKAKEFSQALGVARVSFASIDLMEEILGTKIGAATIFSGLLDSAKNVQIIIDEEVTHQIFYGCSDGTTTNYLKIDTQDILAKYLPSIKNKVKIIELNK
ncbi:YbaK/EbsC family protein [Enterococcus sp. AZ103]|uniref:YbaK/EbsC family protein n=1 Tax=Enterococcus sp. AZ103 TaxID=2774628 RepID=UPI003F1F0B5C